LYQYTNEIEGFLINSVTLDRTEHKASATYRGTDANYATGTLSIANNQTGYLYLTTTIILEIYSPSTLFN
jgi:hypothetical protein